MTNGDRNALSELYGRFHHRLFRYAYGILDDSHLAEDVVQEVFLKLIERPETFDSNRKFSSWIYAVTGNACKNTLRNMKNRQRILADGFNPIQNCSSSENRPFDLKVLNDRIKRAFSDLTDKEKQVFFLRFEHEKPLKEIAEILEIPEGSVKSCLFYLMKKMATQLKEFKYE